MFAHFLNLVFERKPQTRYLYIVGFGTNRVRFAVEFLNEEVELSAHERFGADFPELGNMGVKPRQFLVDIALIGEQCDLGKKPALVRFDALEYLLHFRFELYAVPIRHERRALLSCPFSKAYRLSAFRLR